MRVLLLLLGLTTVVLGWPVEHRVSELRRLQNEASDRVLSTARLTDRPTVAEAKAKYEAARKDFGNWHLWSLLLNFVTIILVTIAMALAAQLPGTRNGISRTGVPKQSLGTSEKLTSPGD